VILDLSESSREIHMNNIRIHPLHEGQLNVIIRKIIIKCCTSLVSSFAVSQGYSKVSSLFPERFRFWQDCTITWKSSDDAFMTYYCTSDAFFSMAYSLLPVHSHWLQSPGRRGAMWSPILGPASLLADPALRGKIVQMFMRSRPADDRAPVVWKFGWVLPKHIAT
jgi:hypothetical protein